MSLLAVEGVSKEFAVEGGIFRRRIGVVRALDQVSFAMEEGDSLGVVGESGSGKTTLARILTRMLAPDGGRVLWEGRPMESFTAREWAGNVQMIHQDPSASLNPKLTVRTLLEEPLRLRARLAGRRADSPAAAADCLAAVGLPADALSHYPHQFSGGQKQRVAIARALAAGPRLLIADEPVSALDLSIQAQILNLLMDLQERFRLTVLVISHDLAVVSALADRALVLKEGRAVEAGSAADVLARPKHPYTQALLEAVPQLVR
ncbi:MAG: ATP-binding cassette domain-containing protein [Elusimicrobiota bacterium]